MNLINLLYNYGNYSNYGGYGNYNYTSPSSNFSGNDFAAIIGGVLAGLGILLFFIAVIAILLIIANWKLFKKMGLDGWKSLIPFVKEYLQMEKTGVDQRWLLIIVFGYLLFIIPILGWLAYLIAIIYFYIIYNVSLARSFGKSDSFAVGLILLAPVFVCILAFGDSKYIGKNPMNDVLFKKKETNEPKTKQEKSSSKKGSFCPSCGEKANSGDVFCTKCGTKLN